MNTTQLAAYVRLKTKTDSATFTDADILTIANVYKDEISNKINDANEDVFGVIIENDLEANKRNYALDPLIMSKVKYFEASFDGVTYKRLVEVNLNTITITTDNDSIKTYMAGIETDKEAGYFMFGAELYILNNADIIDVPNGLRMWIITFPADLPSMTGLVDMSVAPSATELGFPRTFHELLARRIIIDYKSSQEKPIPLTENELNYEKDLKIAISLTGDRNLDRDIIATVPDRRNNGQDY